MMETLVITWIVGIHLVAFFYYFKYKYCKEDLAAFDEQLRWYANFTDELIEKINSQMSEAARG